MERELRQVQKMQAIGTLAGGIAHDFNNILSAIVGYAELARMHAASVGQPTGTILLDNLDGIFKSAGRAKELVRRILSFSSHHDAELHPVDLGVLLIDTIAMLRAMIPTTINIRHKITTSENKVLANVTQLQQVFMNLGTNAYHAMRPEGGELIFELTEAEIEKQDQLLAGPSLPAGKYLKVKVQDSGCGMDRKTVERIFDPYFTTKKEEGGTGLGLSVVHGIIAGHQGQISVESTPEQGTTFQIYLPQIDASCERAEAQDEITDLTGAGERILVVDDEEDLVKITQAILENLGYRVTASTSSREAAEKFCSNPEGFDLIVSDMNMPVMNGAELIEQVRNARDDIPLVVCTGFSDLMNDTRIRELGKARFLMKPVIVEDLNRAIKELLAH